MSDDRTDALLIALNWGTSSLRAYLLGNSGVTLAETSLPLGIMRLQQHSSNFDRPQLHRAFDGAFEQAVGFVAGDGTLIANPGLRNDR
jgi:2-dehydro-3-deoxygalactonokinase